MKELRSIDSITFCQGLDQTYGVFEKHYISATNASESLSRTGKQSVLYKTGRLPVYLNGEKLASKKVLLSELEKIKGTRTATRVTFCTDSELGFEVALSVRTFASWAAFERSPYCRKSISFTSSQLEQHKLLTKS